VQQVKTGKLNKLEISLLVLTGLTLAFLFGRYLGAGGAAAGYTVAAERSAAASPEVSQTETPAPGLLEGERIDLNTASQSDLERLPGIGQKRAEDIVAYRKAHGPFRTVEELTDVPGIGEKTLQGLLDYITVGED
jgi:comEA protein